MDKKEYLKKLFLLSDDLDNKINQYEILLKLKKNTCVFNIENQINSNFDNETIDEFNRIMIDNEYNTINNNTLNSINSKDNLISKIDESIKYNINYNINFERDNFENYLNDYYNKLQENKLNNKLKKLKNEKQNYLSLYNVKKNELINKLKINQIYENKEKIKKNNDEKIDNSKTIKTSNLNNNILNVLDFYFQDEILFLNMNFIKDKKFKIFNFKGADFSLINSNFDGKYLNLSINIQNKLEEIVNFKAFKIEHKNDIELISDDIYKNQSNFKLNSLETLDFNFKFKIKYFKYCIPTIIMNDTKILLPLLIFNFLNIEFYNNPFETKISLDLNLYANNYLKLFFENNYSYFIEINNYEIYLSYKIVNDIIKIDIGYNIKKYNRNVISNLVEHLRFLEIKS